MNQITEMQSRINMLTAEVERLRAPEAEQSFLKAVASALKGDHNDLRREAIILQAFRAALKGGDAETRAALNQKDES